MNSRYERQLIKQGFNVICGVDEAGRGAYAGPLVAAAVVLDFNKRGFYKLIKDSKLLSPNQRNIAVQKILDKSLAWSLGVVSHQEIDEKGLGVANRMALQRAETNLSIDPDYVLSDYMPGTIYKAQSELIKQGDRKIISIAAASIIAKVFRDRMMVAFSRKYPQYKFESNKGYGTLYHRNALSEYGTCQIHRQSFELFR